MKLSKIFPSGLIFLATTTIPALAQTGLFLSGNTVGIFELATDADASIASSTTNEGSSFRRGVPLSGSFQSGVQFNSYGFENVGDGSTFSSGLISYFNGINRIGTSSGNAQLDIYLRLIDPVERMVHLTTINFAFNATPNLGGKLVPDTFRASFIQPEPIRLGDQWVTFTVNDLANSISLAENGRLDLGSISVSFIPEPATNALLVGLAIAGYILIRRLRGAATFSELNAEQANSTNN